MAITLKYHKTIKNYHYYQRAWPKALIATAKERGLLSPFVKATGLDQYAPIAKVEKALAHWNEVYEDMVQMLQRSSSDDISAELRTRMVKSYLEAKGYSPGAFAAADEDDDTWEAMQEVLSELFGDDLLQDHPQFKGKPNASKEFIKATVGMLQEPSEVRVTFAEAMNAYLEVRQKKTAGDRLKKEVSYCNRFVNTVGDHLLTTESAGKYLKQYRNHLLESYKPSTAARMMSSPKAALNHAADTLCTDVFIPEVRVAGSTQYEDRYTLTEKEIIQLIDLVTTPDYKIPDYVRLFYLVAVHGGAHMLEVRQTLVNDIMDWSGGLCVRIRGTKTDARERVVPLLDEFVPYIQRYLPAGEGSLLSEAGDISDPAIDKQLAKACKVVNQKATPYSLRHGCRSLAIAYSVPEALQQALMGWTTSGNQKMDRYGLSGQAYDEQMHAKHEAQTRMLQKVAAMLASKAA